MSRPGTPPAYAVTRFAVRPAGRPGWVMVDITCDAEELPPHLAGVGLHAEEVRQVNRYSTRQTPAHALWLAGHDASDFPMGGGWGFDRQAACWRAADESVIEPPGPAPAATILCVSFGPSDVGWVRVTLEALTQRAVFDISSVFDPLEDIAIWLETLLDGGTPRLMIDVEGWEVEWHSFDAGEDRVRFVVVAAWDLDKTKTWLDLVLQRSTLINAVYKPLLQFWHDNIAPGRWLDDPLRQDPTKKPRDQEEDRYDF